MANAPRLKASSCNYLPTFSTPTLTLATHRFDHKSRFPAITEEMAQWIADGSLKRKFHVVEGLEQAPAALPMLFNGGNTGKLCVLFMPCYPVLALMC